MAYKYVEGMEAHLPDYSERLAKGRLTERQLDAKVQALKAKLHSGKLTIEEALAAEKL